MLRVLVGRSKRSQNRASDHQHTEPIEPMNILEARFLRRYLLGSHAIQRDIDVPECLNVYYSACRFSRPPHVPIETLYRAFAIVDGASYCMDDPGCSTVASWTIFHAREPAQGVSALCSGLMLSSAILLFAFSRSHHCSTLYDGNGCHRVLHLRHSTGPPLVYAHHYCQCGKVICICRVQ